MLIEYRDWSPTPLDVAGAFLDDDRSDWLVAPCVLTRDSDALAESNFEQQALALAAVDPDALDREVYTFGHWGPGLVEIILVRPGSTAATAAESLASRLADYPVLDEEDYTRREWEQYTAAWVDGDAVRDLAWLLRRSRLLSAAAADTVADGDRDAVREWFESRLPSGDYYDPESGCYPRVRSVFVGLGRDDDGGRRSLAGLLRRLRSLSRTATD